jgi:hypothetical protein
MKIVAGAIGGYLIGVLVLDCSGWIWRELHRRRYAFLFMEHE